MKKVTLSRSWNLSETVFIFLTKLLNRIKFEKWSDLMHNFIPLKKWNWNFSEFWIKGIFKIWENSGWKKEIFWTSKVGCWDPRIRYVLMSWMKSSLHQEWARVVSCYQFKLLFSEILNFYSSWNMLI